MTEDEAKTKWCPMVRMLGVETAKAGGQYFGAANTFDGEQEQRAMCIASACMMWAVDHCGLASRTIDQPIYITAKPPLSLGDANPRVDRAIAAGVYSNPQPGDADHPEKS